MPGWLRSAGSGPLTSMRSNATSTAWIDSTTNEKEDKEKKMTDREQYTPGPASGAQVRKDGEKWTLILVRELRHSPEKVWQALTDPAHLREWAPFDADGSLATAGSTVKLTTVGAPTPQVSETTVTRADAPKVLEYNWGGYDMRWELEAAGGGTRLTLWTNIDRRFISMGAAGWHICFDVLDHLLGGTPIGRIVGPDAMKFGGWQRLNAEYAKQFGVETLPKWEVPMNWNSLDPADPPLGVHRLHGDRHRQLRRPGAGRWDASALGDLLAAAPARLAPVHRSVYVRAAVCRQVAQPGGEHEEVRREPRPVGIGAHLETNRRTRGLARGNPQQNAQAHQGSRPGRRRGVEVGQIDRPGIPVWSHDGIICTGESYKNAVKLTFAKGASLKDPARLFNSSLDGNVRRAIDIHEGEEVDASAFKALVRQAVALNRAGTSKTKKKTKS